MKDFDRIAAAIAAVTSEKDQAYGPAFEQAGAFLALLYPDGIPVARYQSVAAAVRVFDKLMRLAHDPGAYGESPWRDIGGYALLGAELDERTKGETP